MGPVQTTAMPSSLIRAKKLGIDLANENENAPMINEPKMMWHIGATITTATTIINQYNFWPCVAWEARGTCHFAALLH